MPYFLSSNLSDKELYLRQAARKLKPGTTSQYRGVSLNKKTLKWCASLAYMGRRYYLGVHDTEISAAKAYNRKALEVIGNHAILNQIPKDA